MPHVEADTIVIENPRRVATCGPLGVLQGDVCLGIRKGRLRYLGPRAQLPVEFTNAARFDAGRRPTAFAPRWATL